MTRLKTRLKTADRYLSSEVTSNFIEALLLQIEAYGDSQEFDLQYLKEQLLTKFVRGGKDDADNRQRAAIEKWLSVEQRNAETNHNIRVCEDRGWPSIILKNQFRDDFGTHRDISHETFVRKCREIVRQIIGDHPSLDLLHGGFSGGASTSKSRRHSHPAVKFLDKADATRPALSLWYEITRGTQWATYVSSTLGLEPKCVSSNIMFTVPKSDVIDRVAAMEPDLNMFLQKMFGNQIRSLLRRKGVNLNDQTRNQELARIGSLDGSLATIDLSSASDTVTVELVKALMPDDWFYFLNTVRCHSTVLPDGTIHQNQMFSSMGNGFTFELESLIFYALARTTAYFFGVRGSISVYGDDIIIPSLLWKPFQEVLTWFGFVPNEKKTHHTGLFRESCGAHWYAGRDVSPFYIKGPFRRVSDLILTLNQLVQWASRETGVVDPRFEEIFNKFKQYVPEHLWGGQDLTSRHSLVTGDAPRKELIYPTERIPHDHIGGYLFWLFLAEKRATGSPVGDTLTTDGSSLPRFARVRRNRQWWTDVPVFLKRYGI